MKIELDKLAKILLIIGTTLIFSILTGMIKHLNDLPAEKIVLQVLPVREKVSESQIKGEISKEDMIKDLANKAILALKNKDFSELSDFVHPEKGVSFVPYAFTSEQNLNFSKKQIKNLYQSKTEYLWSSGDNGGNLLNTTFKDYYSQYIYDEDFAEAKDVSYYDQASGNENVVDNIADFYKNSVSVEYSFFGDGSMDWKSLRLVFQEKEGVWYLVAVIHDQLEVF